MALEPASASATSALTHALDVSSERHSLLARNLANLNTPGYTRMDLEFESALRDQAGPPAAHAEASGSPSLVKETGAMASNDAFYVSCTRLLQLDFQARHAALKDR